MSVFFQDLLTGSHCCLDIMGSTKFKTSQANWDKKCCDNEKGPAIPPPRNITAENKVKINKQIERMPTLKSVSHKLTSMLFIVSSFFGFLVVLIFSINIVICILHPIWFLLVKYCPKFRAKLGGFDRMEACISKIKQRVSITDMVKRRINQLWGRGNGQTSSMEQPPTQKVKMNAKTGTIKTIA